jgi:hypothetical protein
LDDFALAYLDDVLIFSDTFEDHVRQVREVLVRLRDAGLQIDINKCEFHVQETLYLGMIISTEGIRMDPAKVQAVLEWETPRSVKDVQSFLGFANFYRHFILKFSLIATPLTDLTKKDGTFEWSPRTQGAFEALKRAFTSNPVLAYFEPGRETCIKTDANGNVVACVASQKHIVDGKEVWKPVAYFSKKMTPAERNYDIYDKELLAIIKAFDEYKAELMPCTDEPIIVVTDHKNLEYFMTTKMLNERQARWGEKLSPFNLRITYRPGRLNVRADALTRRPQDEPTEEVVNHREQTLLKPELFVPPPAFVYDLPPIATAATTTRSATRSAYLRATAVPFTLQQTPPAATPVATDEANLPLVEATPVLATLLSDVTADLEFPTDASDEIPSATADLLEAAVLADTDYYAARLSLLEGG